VIRFRWFAVSCREELVELYAVVSLKNMLPSCDTVSLVGGKKPVELYAVASSKGMFPSCDKISLVGGEKSWRSCTRWHR
jgi:hypothetical protein